jgi:hypothetical protein
MSTKASAIFQTIHNLKSSNCKIFYYLLLTNKVYLMCMTNKAVVLWVKVQGKSAHDCMKTLSQEISVTCKVISSSDIDVAYTFWESVKDSILSFGSRCG